MHFEPHATLGWTIGILGGADRRLRNYCVVGAVLPDIDAAAYLFGPLAYGEWHHTFGHNVFLWAAFVGWVTWRCRSWRALLLSALAFGSHLLTDAQFSGWRQYLLWPISHEGYVFSGAVGLEAPINYWLVYASPAVIVILAAFFRRTPIDIFSPALDRLIVSFFEAKKLSCAACGRACNQICAECGGSVCARHTRIQRSFRLICANCEKRREPRPGSVS